MKKENGRLKPASNQEKSSSKGKKFKCPICKSVVYMKDIEFGGKYICTECDLGILEEV